VKNSFYFNEFGKEVSPKDGKFDQEKFAVAEAEYRLALKFSTRNSMSGSYQFKFSDGGQIFREMTKDTDKT
jgi:hypothetical protein